jgi:hypothetical protein
MDAEAGKERSPSRAKTTRVSQKRVSEPSSKVREIIEVKNIYIFLNGREIKRGKEKMQESL